jgi:parallel beta-helix repeat protein/putative cofactor-binding repeat protein
MGTSVFAKLRTSCLLFASVALAVLFVGPTPAAAFGGILNDWENTYPDSDSGFNADCQLCHVEANGGDPFNAYGWTLVLALEPDGCGPGDLDLAFACSEEDDSDLDPTGSDNLTEIDASTQPGWTDGPFNTWYSREAPPDENNLPPAEPIGPLDPDGTGGTGGTGGGGGTAGGGGTGGTGGDECDPGHDRIPPGQFKRGTIVVKPGQSIQEALDRAQEGTRIFVHGGVYTEPCNETNGLEITKSGIHLIGQSNKNKRVIIESTNGQRNGIAIVAPEVPAAAQPLGREVEHTDCMGCHTDMAPPFPLLDDVPTGLDTDGDPWLYDVTVESITIRGFRNNGIFTRHVDGFLFHDLESINNRNYGIFPVLSKNGAITDSFSTGSDLDSALWVETSENVLVQGNVLEKSTNGIEVSNSDDILVIDNEMRDNTIGAAILLLPDIYDDRPGAKRIHLINNWIHDNNRPNGANPGSILGFFPAGEGILFAGVDDSVISGNLIENNDFIGIAIADYCGALAQTPFACPTEPSPEFPAGFLLDQAAENNTVVGNVLVNNATDPDPGPPEHPPNPFAFAAGDLSLLTLPTFIVGLPGDPTPFHGNCYEDNVTSSTPEFFALWYAFLFENPDLVQPEGPFPPPPFPPWAPPSCP